MSAWLLDVNGNWHEANGEIETRIIDFITRLQTIKGEQSFNADNGLDFLNIINGSSLLEIEVENIARNFNNYFDVTVGKAEEDRKSKVMKIDINMKLKNSSNEGARTSRLDTKVSRESLGEFEHSNNETLNYTALIGA